VTRIVTTGALARPLAGAPARARACDAPSANQEHMMSTLSRRNALAGGALAMLLTAAQPAFSEEKGMTKLFKIITIKDEIVIGLNESELGQIGGNDAGAVAKALAAKGEMTAWQYAVKHAANGDLQQAPLRQVGLLANASLRVEPYTTTYAVVPHE
jgi:hypothetical protein